MDHPEHGFVIRNPNAEQSLCCAGSVLFFTGIPLAAAYAGEMHCRIVSFSWDELVKDGTHTSAIIDQVRGEPTNQAVPIK